MKKMYQHEQCLTYHELKWYCTKSMDMEEQKEVYKHLSGCELCALAVNGFSAMPFTEKKVERIHERMDMKTRAAYRLPRLPFAEVLVAGCLLLAVLGYLVVVNSSSEIKPALTSICNIEPPTATAPVKKADAGEDSQSSLRETKRPVMIKKEETKPEERKAVEVEKLPTPALPFNDLLITRPATDPVSRTSITDEYMYIEDFKVVDYSRLYTPAAPLPEPGGFTPASKENKKSVENETASMDEQKLPAGQLLKNSLHYLHKQNYLEANTGFLLLLAQNDKDVNALFYSGICCMEMNNYNFAIKQFGLVLKNNNPAFRQEANWKLAQTYLLTGEKEQAKAMFKEIAEEGGFYAEKAREKLVYK